MMEASLSIQLLAGQTALVTGATSGIGRAVAEGLAKAGAAVAVNYRSGSEEAAEGICRGIRDFGGEASPVRGDVTVEHDVQQMVDLTVSIFGSLDILVANSGIQADAAFRSMKLEQWRMVVDTNLTGAFLCARSAVDHFLGQGRRGVSRAVGKIVFMSSVHEAIPWAGHANYAASKGGLHMLMRTLAQEVAADGIRVNSIAPGFIKTPINEETWKDANKLERALALIPLGYLGDPDDVAKAAVWLASDESSYITGTSMFVDGGMALYPSFRNDG